MSQLDETETNSQWVRRLAATDSDEPKSVSTSPVSTSSRGSSSSSVIIDEESTKEAAIRNTLKPKKVFKIEPKEPRGARDTTDSSIKTQLFEEVDGEEQEKDEEREEEEGKEEEKEEEEEGEVDQTVIDLRDKVNTSESSMSTNANESQNALAIVADNDEPMEKERDPEPNRSFSSVAKKRLQEAAKKFEALKDVDAEVRPIILSTFLMLFELTTPETPAEEWKKMMVEFAANEEEKAEGDVFVDREYPRENMSAKEKHEAHRKLARAVVTRYIRSEMAKVAKHLK